MTDINVQSIIDKASKEATSGIVGMSDILKAKLGSITNQLGNFPTVSQITAQFPTISVPTITIPSVSAPSMASLTKMSFSLPAVGGYPPTPPSVSDLTSAATGALTSGIASAQSKINDMASSAVNMAKNIETQKATAIADIKSKINLIKGAGLDTDTETRLITELVKTGNSVMDTTINTMKAAKTANIANLATAKTAITSAASDLSSKMNNVTSQLGSLGL